MHRVTCAWCPTNELTHFVHKLSGRFVSTSECFSAVVSKKAFLSIFSYILALLCGFSWHNFFDSDYKATHKNNLSQKKFDARKYHFFFRLNLFSRIFTFHRISFKESLMFVIFCTVLPVHDVQITRRHILSTNCLHTS